MSNIDKKPVIVPDIYSGITPNVNVGDCYQFKYDMSTRAGHIHLAGSYLYVVDFTVKSPFDEISASGKNWVCKTVHGTSIWATLEHCISRNLFNKVDPPVEK